MLCNDSNCRDLRETRQRFDSVGSEIKRKDNQIRELQQRLDVNEGCKCLISLSILIFKQIDQNHHLESMLNRYKQHIFRINRIRQEK